MANLLGPVVGKRRFRPRDTGSVRPATESPIVPDYVRDNASSYHFEEFERLWRSTEIQGKRVLEVGSDYHLISARLFQANGAAEVVATNLGDWTSDAPLPEGVKVLVGDVADLADTVLDLASFDIIYGVAILEHISDLDRVAAALKRLLKPDGIAYLQERSALAGIARPSRLGEPRGGRAPRSRHDQERATGDGGGLQFRGRKRRNRTRIGLISLQLQRSWPPFSSNKASRRRTPMRSRIMFTIEPASTPAPARTLKRPARLSTPFETFSTLKSSASSTPILKSSYYATALINYSESDLSTLGLRLRLRNKATRVKGGKPRRRRFR